MMEQYLLLDPRQRALYRDVMQESYETLMALEFPLSKPELLSQLEDEVTAFDLENPRGLPPAVPENMEEANPGQEVPIESRPLAEASQSPRVSLRATRSKVKAPHFHPLPPLHHRL
ncbi:hypothetical protein JRQ81_003358 [Phrynocephalus forsythii]|uniref:KRAB domain-containing protein n=1 Tax=Phrynocephalus forsythii TaxID=171643 RepID=A0A9Q0XKC6_9SAUR|nr:hypothetical protein JRQ81_003358 [Phrynocephalus forsythii]